MKTLQILILVAFLTVFTACTKKHYEEKGFHLTPDNTDEGLSEETDGTKASQKPRTRPGGVILTGIADYRLVPVYKINYDKRSKEYYTGSNIWHYSYSEEDIAAGNAWHYHFMPGLEAVYGYNVLNLSLYNIKTKIKKPLFKSHVLIKTIYYPSYLQDTLNGIAVVRDYWLVSVYDEDTNGDSSINTTDLRRLYHFDLEGKSKNPLIPLNYSVISSEYDPANDLMYVYAQCDMNSNGEKEVFEKIHVFWIDLKNPLLNGRIY